MSTSHTDELLERARAGDTRALEDLLRSHYERVAALCRRIAGHSDADDCTQEALIAVVRGLPRFDGRSAFGTWLYRVATNACLDELRRRARRPDPVDHTERHATGADHAATVADRLDVDAALAKIPLDYRVPVVLRDLCGLDYDEIAGTLGIPGGTVRSRIARGRGALADLLGAGTPAPSTDVQPSDHG